MEDCVFIGFTTVESPEIQEKSESSFIKSVIEHEKRDILIEIIERVCKRLNELRDLKILEDSIERCKRLVDISGENTYVTVGRSQEQVMELSLPISGELIVGENPSDKINIKTCEKTCSGFPAQWECITDNDKHVYIRYRGGSFSARIGDTEDDSIMGRALISAEHDVDDYGGRMTTDEMVQITKDVLDFTKCTFSGAEDFPDE